MQAFRFFLDIVSLVPSGPLTSVRYWRYIARMDGAGSIAFEVSATDPQAEYLTNLSEVHAFALLRDGWTEVGAGIVNNIKRVINQDGTVTLQCSGLDLIGELNTKGVRDLEIGEGDEDGTTLANALSILNAFAPSGWALNANSVPATDFVYTKFDGESMLGALIYIAEKTKMHFYRIPARQLEFTNTFEDSEVTIVKASGDLNENVCTATVLDRTIDTHDLQTRLYGWGSGEDRLSSLTTIATTRVAPAGYTHNASENYIQNDAAVALYGIRDFPERQYKDITLISNTNADYVAASNLLFDSMLADLQRVSTLDQQVKYDLALANCPVLLRPLQTVRVLYHDPVQGIEINDDLYILESTLEWNSNDLATTGLVVSTHSYWPKGANDNAAERAIQGKVFAGHKQISVNEWQSHKEMVIGDNQTDHVGEFPFIFSGAVVQVLQVYFRFKVGQILAYFKSYTLDATTLQNDAANTGDTTLTPGQTTATVNNTALTVTTTGGTVIEDTLLTTDAASPDHETGTNTGNIGEMTSADLSTNPTPHSHTVTEHTHEFAHNHGINFHGHNVTTEHGHTITDHTHTGSLHGHTLAPNPHNHTSPQHTHPLTDVLNETKGLELAPALSTYALSDLEFSVNGGISNPAWDPDSDGWASLDIATDASDGYWQIDITDEVTHPTIPFRPAQASGNNVIEIRRKTAAGTGKSALVQCVLYCRTTIQGVTLS